MTTAEILKKVKRIEIKTKGLSSQIFSGAYHSAFKGKGMSFTEVREYLPGDDVRSIDWNVTARFSAPYIKVFEEERELCLMLLIDISSSANMGIGGKGNKRNVMAELAALLAFSATTNNDQVGAIFFSDKIEYYIPPQKGKSHILRIIRALVTLEPANESPTNIAHCLEFLNKVVKRKAITFLLSDLLAPNFERELKMAARKHDLVGIQVADKIDAHLPDMGLIKVKDVESGKELWIDSSDKGLQLNYKTAFKKHQGYCNLVFQRAGAQLIQVNTEQDYVPLLQNFFRSRL